VLIEEVGEKTNIYLDQSFLVENHQFQHALQDYSLRTGVNVVVKPVRFDHSSHVVYRSIPTIRKSKTPEIPYTHSLLPEYASSNSSFLQSNPFQNPEKSLCGFCTFGKMNRCWCRSNPSEENIEFQRYSTGFRNH